MKLFKKIVSLAMVTCLFVTGVGCSNPGDSGQIPPATTTVQKINSSILDGKVANLMEAEGFGIVAKADTPAVASANPFSAVAYADEGDTQKKTELVKKTDDGVTDIRFHNVDGGAKKSYKHLNKKYDKHHHKSVECGITDCDKISDEITQEENSGAVDTVLSLGARVNKLYTVGEFTFVSISSAVEGKIKVMELYTRNVNESFGPNNGFPTNVNVIDNLNTSKGFGFSWIAIEGEDGKSGMIPIKIYEDEDNYHKINYWSDDYNQSYIIDNNTGLTCSLSQFGYIYSVSGGLIKIYDQSAPSGFNYYKPLATESGITFNKVEFPDDPEFLLEAGSSNVHTDIYGNMVFSNNKLKSPDDVDLYGEKKIADNIILAQKNQMIAVELNNKHDTLGEKNYTKANVYHNGSDGRLYRVNFFGDLNNISLSVLDENCTWQAVEKDITVEFTFAYVAWQVGVITTAWDALRLTCIIDGNAYFSTAAQTDGGMLWPQAFFADNDHYVGVVKMPVDGFADGDTTIQDFITEFKNQGYPVDRSYGVILVGNTQMLYFGRNKIFLRDVKTGEEKSFDTPIVNNGFGAHKGGNLFVKNLGYLNVEEEIDLATFGASSFSESPVSINDDFEEYYKLIKGLN